MSQIHQEVLISAQRNLRVESRTISSEEVTPDCPHAWSITKQTLHGGKQEGVDVIVVDNGTLSFTVVPTRGMGILEVVKGDLRLGWESPIKEVVHPRFINLHTRGGIGWLEGFNEWICRCGLESAGAPGDDVFINNNGNEATMQLTLHGKIANTPASEVEVLIERAAPWRIRIRGRVDERCFFGPSLELWAEISTEPGSSAVRINDQVTNRGGSDQEFQLIYHTNFGRPLLEGGARLVAPTERVHPINETALAAIDTYPDYLEPTPGFIEQVYCMWPYADDQGVTSIMLRNAAEDRAVTMTYPIEHLPYLTVWKNTASVETGYATGLEPGVTFPRHRSRERADGRLPVLTPGASHRVCMDIAIEEGVDAVTRAAARIEEIQAGRQTNVDRQPLGVI